MNADTSAFPSPNSQLSDALNSQRQLSTMISGMHEDEKKEIICCFLFIYLFIKDFLCKKIFISYLHTCAILLKKKKS